MRKAMAAAWPTRPPPRPPAAARRARSSTTTFHSEPRRRRAEPRGGCDERGGPAALPRRPCRQPAASAGPAARGRGRGDPPDRAAAARDRPALRHRRRVPPRLLAYRFSLPHRRGREDRPAHAPAVPQRAGNGRGRACGLPHRRQVASRRDDLRRGFFLPQSGRAGRRDREADDPLALNAALPRRARGDRPHRLSRDGSVLARSRRGLCQTDRRPFGARLYLSAIGRHQPCLSQRSRPARVCDPHRRRRRASAPHQHPPDQSGAAKPPAGMTITVHLCRGNFRSSWMAEGGYDHVAEALFGELAVDGYFLEYDDARSGGFAPLRFVPKGKRVVLGLVTTKRAALESKDDLKRRIDEAARYVPLDQLCLSPQCGFSSTVDGNRLSEEEQFAKLRLVVDTAREVWG